MPGKSLKRQAIEATIKQAVDEAVGAAESRYLKAFDTRAHGYALLGHTNDEIAELIGVSATTFDEWLVAHPSLARSIQRARVDDNVRLVKALNRAGRGFRAREERLLVVKGKVQKHSVTKVYPPSVPAIQFALGNRVGQHWRDTKTVEHKGNVNLLALVEGSMGDRAKPVQAKVLEQDQDD